MNEPTFESFFSIPEWLGTQMFTALIGIFIIIVLSLFFHIRAGSSYGLIGRLYAMLIGGSEFHHNSVAEFWREQKDVERFNALFNTKTKSLKEIQKFTSWLKNNELQPRNFTGLRDWFDFEKTKVKKIKIWHVAVPPVFLFLIFSFAFLFTAFACINSALIRFDNEKQWMWLSHTEARSFSLNFFQDRSNSWSIDEYMCSNSDLNPEKMANTSRLQKDTVRTICKSFNNAEDAKHIDKIIAEQKTLLLPALFLWFFDIIFFIEIKSIVAAMSARCYLRNRLKKVRLRRKVLVSSC